MNLFNGNTLQQICLDAADLLRVGWVQGSFAGIRLKEGIAACSFTEVDNYPKEQQCFCFAGALAKAAEYTTVNNNDNDINKLFAAVENLLSPELGIASTNGANLFKHNDHAFRVEDVIAKLVLAAERANAQSS